MRFILVFIVLSFCISSFSQDNTEGQYKVGILPAMSSASGGGYYLENLQALISSVFTGKSRFTVVDRSRFAQIVNERNLQKQEDFINSNYIVDQGKTLGAQFLISGNITQLSKSGGNVERTRYVTGADKKSYPQKLAQDTGAM